MARVNGFDILGKLCIITGVLGEAGARIYLHLHPNSATKAAVADTLGIQSDQVLIFNGLLLLRDYGVYVAAAGLLLLCLAKLAR